MSIDIKQFKSEIKPLIFGEDYLPIISDEGIFKIQKSETYQVCESKYYEVKRKFEERKETDIQLIKISDKEYEKIYDKLKNCTFEINLVKK